MTAYRTIPYLRREHFSCQRCQIIVLYWRYFGNPLSALVCPGSQWIAVMNCEGWEGNAQCIVPKNYIGIVWRNWGKTQRSWKYSRCPGPKFDRRTFLQFDSAAQSPQFIFAEPININLQSNWHFSNICNEVEWFRIKLCTLKSVVLRRCWWLSHLTHLSNFTEPESWQ
jgi:hypothetical protein